MQAIVDNIYIGDQFPGATLGVINMPHGLIQVDAPPSPEDGRAWRAALLNLGGGSERLLVNLDAHPDRTLGDRAMDCTIVAQEKTAHVFRTRPTTFKAQGEETGSDWESIPGLGNIRWVTPEITFSHQMAIHWGDSSVILEHHPGPTAERRVVDRAVPVGRPLAQVVHPKVEQAVTDGLAYQREPQRREVLGEDRHDVDPHVRPRAGRARPGRRRRPAGREAGRPAPDHRRCRPPARSPERTASG